MDFCLEFAATRSHFASNKNFDAKTIATLFHNIKMCITIHKLIL